MINVVLILFQLLVHPFHVSVSDIKYKEDERAIQITTRIFLDDLELALQSYTGNESLDIVAKENWELVSKNLKSYLLERIRLWDEKGKEYQLNYVGAEIENDVMWAYLEIERVRKLKQVKVHNSILTEVWGDQENLVHFRAFGSVKSARLLREEDTQVFEWE